jgi:hypothetical protein
MQSKAERSSPGGALPPDDAAAKMIRNLIYGTHKEAAFKSETLLSDLSNGGDIYGPPYTTVATTYHCCKRTSTERFDG